MQDAAARKAQLQALREAAAAAEEAAGGQQPMGAEQLEVGPQQEPLLKFRNYRPNDETVQRQQTLLQSNTVQVPEFEAVRADVEAVLGKDLEEVLISVAPQKANWDLRRDIATKLGKIEQRTQAAMIKLMQEEEQRQLAASRDK